jgi:peptidoglycan DL-endopeptidase CwlO
MLALAFVALAGGVVLMIAGVTGSSIASAAQGHPDHASAAAAGAEGRGMVVSPPQGSVTAASSGKVGTLLDAARSQLGVPYAWGGELAKVEFDCSGLVQWSARQAGISLPRTAQEQYEAVQKLSPSEAGAGDLVFFSNGSEVSHVGIITSAGHMIDAPHTGANVREESFPQQLGALWGTDRVIGFGKP